MFNSIRSSINSMSEQISDHAEHVRVKSDRALSGMIGSSDVGGVAARKHRIQEGLRRANSARDEYEKEGLINWEGGEGEYMELPRGSVASLVGAAYGACDDESGFVDVLGRVEKDLMAGNVIKISNDTMGKDPKPGTRKVLRVKYRPASARINITANEGQDVHLPPHAAEGILSASYGDGNTQKDITLELQGALLTAPGKPVRVSNELFGDPAPGKPKMLSVSYDPSRTRQAFKLQTSKELATFGLVAPWLFRDLCSTVGVTMKSLYASLVDEELTGGEKEVSGKSGEVFWFSSDRKFVLKTIADAEIATLVRMLPEYTAYLAANPDSMLTRYLGVFSLDDNGISTQFVVMNNIFEGAPHMDVMYDLKGTTEDRWVDPEPGKCLKDNNFAETTAYFDDDAATGIHRTITSDTKFLEKQGIMDYSLMVAISRDGGKFQRNLATARFSKFMGGIKGTEAHGVTEDTIQEVTYFIGMVDMLVTYGWKKVAAHIFKSSTIGINEEIDTVAPDRYASRFRAFVGIKVRGVSEKCVVSTLGAEPFVTPMPALGRSGGTAAFFKATYREGAPDPEAQLSRNYWIGKDLARAKDEVAFYEVAKTLQGAEGWDVLKWMTPYKGVCRCPCEVKAGEEAKPVDVMLLRNGRDGYHTCRMLDVKIGQVTAVAGWQGKSALSAWMQTNTIDAVTNSAGQGFRLEGFDSPPETLHTFEELLTEQKLLKTTAVSAAKVKRFNLQRMTACQFVSYFLDLHEVPKAKAGGGYTSSSASAGNALPYPEPGLLTRVETQELVLLSSIEELASLIKAMREVQAPQQWIGSSVMFCFDCGARPSREVLTRGPGKWGVSRLHIFDWGRSELNLPQAHARLEADQQVERQKYWSHYCGAIGKLLYDCCNLYVSRYWHAKKTVAFTVWDKDQFTPDDFLGTVALPMPANGGPSAGTHELSTYTGDPVKSGMLRGTTGTIQATVSALNLIPGSRLEGAATVKIHKIENCPKKDTMSPNDTFVEVTAFPEEPAVVKEGIKRPEVQSLLRLGAHLTSLKIDIAAPVFEEEFELATLTEEARKPLLRALATAFGEERASDADVQSQMNSLFHNTVQGAANEQKASSSRNTFLTKCFPGVEATLSVASSHSYR